MNKKNLKNCEQSRDSIYAVSTPCHLSRHCEVASCLTCEAIHSVSSSLRALKHKSRDSIYAVSTYGNWKSPLLFDDLKSPLNCLLTLYSKYFFMQSGWFVKGLPMNIPQIKKPITKRISPTMIAIIKYTAKFANIVSSLITYITRQARNVTQIVVNRFICSEGV
jgi:hypothetical protein